MTPSMKNEHRGNRCNKRHILHKAVNETLSVLSISIKFGTEELPTVLLSSCECHGNRRWVG